MPRSSRTEYVILGLLTSGPRTGYQLKQEIDQVVSHFWRESYGQIYPVLKRLTAAGLARRDVERGGRRRVLYGITESGRERLRGWLEQPPEMEPPRIELLLKIFFGANTSPRVLRSHLSVLRERMREFLEVLNAAERELAGPEADAPEAAYWRMTVRSGQHVARARLRWARETDAELATMQAE